MGGLSYQWTISCFQCRIQFATSLSSGERCLTAHSCAFKACITLRLLEWVGSATGLVTLWEEDSDSSPPPPTATSLLATNLNSYLARKWRPGEGSTSSRVRERTVNILFIISPAGRWRESELLIEMFSHWARWRDNSAMQRQNGWMLATLKERWQQVEFLALASRLCGVELRVFILPVCPPWELFSDLSLQFCVIPFHRVLNLCGVFDFPLLVPSKYSFEPRLPNCCASTAFVLPSGTCTISAVAPLVSWL